MKPPKPDPPPFLSFSPKPSQETPKFKVTLCSAELLRPPRSGKMSSPKRRIETDVMKLLMSDYEITLVNDSMQEFYVRFHGPEESE